MLARMGTVDRVASNIVMKGDFAAAVEECTAALRYDPEHARAYELRGWV